MQMVFHHIPKAGGTSFRKAIQAAGFTWRKAEFRDALRDADKWIAAWPGIGLYSSHYLFRDYDGPLPYVTWIRDPVDMFYSGYHWYSKFKPPAFYWPQATRTFMEKVMWRHNSLRTYVDAVLTGDYEFAFPRKLFDLKWSRFDFIGVTGQQESIERFNRKFDLDIKMLHSNRLGKPNTYRREEVAKLLEREVAIFESLK